MKLLLAVVILGLVFGESSAHQLKWGSCKTFAPMANFDPSKFEGEWYVIKKLVTNSKCMMAKFGQEGDNTLTIQELRTPSITQMTPWEVTVTNVGRLTMDSTEKARMKLKWDGNFLKDIVDTSFTVLDTDYTSYALDIECQSLTVFHRLSATIYGRNSSLDEGTITMLLDKLEKYSVDLNRMTNIDHSNCVPLSSTDYNIKVDDKGLSLLGLLNNKEIQKLENLEQVQEYADKNIPHQNGNNE
ncbi:apolipoprotein D-like [Palaemon carinicauda]|uniref:apolipoprotein D-like n=1 Tax=Palaemon carinicauda TaxID=392227 RepID=UPI0035B61725